MIKQKNSNYSQKLNVLVNIQSLKNLREAQGSIERKRVQKYDKSTPKNEIEEFNHSQQSFRLQCSTERSASVTQKHRRVIDSPVSKSIHTKENNYYMKQILKDSKVIQETFQGSLTQDASRQQQKAIVNNSLQSLQSINITSQKYEKPIQRIFQQLNSSGMSNKSNLYKNQTQDCIPYYFSLNSDRSNTCLVSGQNSAREDNILKSQQIIQNKYKQIIQHSQLFKKYEQVKQQLPFKLQNMYEINLLDIEDIQKQSPIKDSNQEIEENTSNYFNQQQFNSKNNNATNNHINNQSVSNSVTEQKGMQLNKMKSIFLKNNKQNSDQEQSNKETLDQSDQIIDGQSPQQFSQSNLQITETPKKEIQQNKFINIKSECKIESNTSLTNRNSSMVLTHQMSLKNLSESPFKREDNKRRYTYNPEVKFSFNEKSKQSQQTPIVQDQSPQSVQQNQIAQQNSLNTDRKTTISSFQQTNNVSKVQEIEFCLLDIIEKLDKNVMFEISEKQFDKKYFGQILTILNENMASILIRVNDLLGVNSGVNYFLQYFNNFLNLFFTLAEEQINSQIKKKLDEECTNYIEQIENLKKNIFSKINEQIRSDHKILQLENQISHLKVQFNDEKNRLQMLVNSLEERIEEMTNLERAQEKYDEMSSKIQEMQLFIKNLQNDNRVTTQTLEDNLCSLGHSLMVRAKETLEYQDQIRIVKDNTLFSILNDHPFLTAFIYNKTVQATNIELTEEYMIQRLKVFFKILKEEDLFEKNCSEAFMEYILNVSKSQHDGFQEIEHIVRFILQIEEKQIAQFFIKIFGIMGASIPSQQAIKEVLQLNKNIGQINFNDLEDLVVYDDELDLIIAQSISNQNIILDFKNKFKNQPKILKCQILSHFLQAIIVQQEIEQGDEIYNQHTVSSTETVVTFESKLNYNTVKQLAAQLKVKPFTLMNYILQTYERYSKERKKELNSQKNAQLNGNFIPKVMCDCFKNLQKFQLLYYMDEKSVVNIQNKQKTNNTLVYFDSIMEEEEELQQLRVQEPKKLMPKKKSVDKKKLLINNMKKVKNTIKLINIVSPQRSQTNFKSPSLVQLDTSMNSKKSNQQTPNDKIKLQNTFNYNGQYINKADTNQI